jgi:hypothetical protein
VNEVKTSHDVNTIINHLFFEKSDGSILYLHNYDDIVYISRTGVSTSIKTIKLDAEFVKNIQLVLNTDSNYDRITEMARYIYYIIPTSHTAKYTINVNDTNYNKILNVSDKIYRLSSYINITAGGKVKYIYDNNMGLNNFASKINGLLLGYYFVDVGDVNYLTDVGLSKPPKPKSTKPVLTSTVLTPLITPKLKYNSSCSLTDDIQCINDIKYELNQAKDNPHLLLQIVSDVREQIKNKNHKNIESMYYKVYTLLNDLENILHNDGITLTGGNPLAKTKKEPVFEKDKSKYQTAIWSYLKDLTPEYQLEKLNNMQRGCPFMIADPLQRSCGTGPKAIMYGYADLYRFMGFPFTKGLSRVKDNPFYNPIEYPIPDHKGNIVLNTIYQMNPKTKLRNMKYLLEHINDPNIRNIYSSEYGGPSPRVIYGGSKKSKKNVSVKSSMLNVVDVLDEILRNQYDPSRLSRLIDGQERPMEKYFIDNFATTLSNFNKVHAMVSKSKASDESPVYLKNDVSYKLLK